MSGSSFLEEIRRRKNCLKYRETVITSSTGEKYVRRMKEGGESETVKLIERSCGYVIDDRPDVQVAEILPFLLLSSQDVAHDKKLLEVHGVTHVLSIGVEIPPIACSENVIYKRIELFDLPEADLLSALEGCFDFIEEARNNSSSRILVHCNAGYSRAPSVVIAYLIKYCRLNLREALDRVKSKRNVCPNDGFMKQLKQFENTVTK